MIRSEKLYRDAVASLNEGRLADAERLFRKFLRAHPNHVGALNLLTIVLMRLERYGEAEKFIRPALKINQVSDVSFYNYGIILLRLGRSGEAVEQFAEAIRINPHVTEAWNNRGAAFSDLKQYQAAISDFDRAIALNDSYVDAYVNKGNALSDLGRNQDALGVYDAALALMPESEFAWLGRGRTLHELRLYDDALVAFDKALALRPDLATAWLGCGNALGERKRYGDALAAYDKALALNPELENAWLGRGNVFAEVSRYNDAGAAYDKALALKPDLANAWLGRGNIFSRVKRYHDALAAYETALRISPNLANAWLGCGYAFEALKRYDDAVAAYDKALAHDPDMPGVEGARLHAKMRLCDWGNFGAECARLISRVRNEDLITEPFPFLAIASTPGDQLSCANRWAASKFPAMDDRASHERYQHERIRVAYLSADLVQHATAYLAAGLFEHHDRSRFEITAISLTGNDHSAIRERLTASFERFIAAEMLSDDQIADLIKNLEIDILVDLNGFTKDSRTGVLARRSAPIQVSYLGYPGTMGANYVDYLIADEIVIPQEHSEFYTEKIIRLPHSYQVNDDKRSISEKLFKRDDFGLPENGFVFCCFNNSYKIVPSVFDHWMRILSRVEGSVLWLLEDNDKVVNNLRNEAVARGVEADRLIFAKRMPLSDHLARHLLADLFLDTLPYNAHTTASDALWAGLPVLTCLGPTFAGKVAASLLRAIHLPQLIETTLGGYEQLAVDLAVHPESLAEIRRELKQNRLATPLFDTKLFTRHIEAAYAAVHARHQAGMAPDHIAIPSSP